MFHRLFQLFKKLRGALLNHVDHPQETLERSYHDLQSSLSKVRQAIAQAVATEKQLSLQLQSRQNQKKDTAELEIKFELQHETTEGLRKQLRDLESEVQRLYIDKQVRIARHKATGESLNDPLPSQVFLFTLVFLILWALVGVSIAIRHGF